MSGGNDNVFVRHSRKTRAVVSVLATLAVLSLAELSLRLLLGLGNPVLYDSSPVYGFRPLPNREYRRFHGVTVRFNNLGLRADRDFDGDPATKVLFLGDSVTYGGSGVATAELFSQRAVEGMGPWQSGNAGVNGWGVENIHGLIVESQFLPAEIYVTTLPEVDFYRGLTQCESMPFFNVSPRFALVELWRYFCYTQNRVRYRNWRAYADEAQIRHVVEKATCQLKEMDDLLAQRGFDHLLFITPSRDQAAGRAARDPIVEQALAKYGLHPFYINDSLSEWSPLPSDRERLFYDSVHLRKEGHAIWARVIRRELEKVVARRTRAGP